MTNLSDDDINEVIGDGTCTHLPQVRMALEIRRDREMKKRLEEWCLEIPGVTPIMGGTTTIGGVEIDCKTAQAFARELRNRMRGG